MTQKRWALLLVLCLLAGCLGPALAEISFPLADEPVTLRFVARQAPNHADYGDMLVWQKYEALTNVHIDWIMIPQANYTERRNLMFATNDLPDAMYRTALSLTDTAKYVAEGQLLSMSEYLPECPNLTAFYERHPDVVKSITMSDGKIYTAGYYNEHPALKVGTRIFINQTWLDNLGLEMPGTTDELADVLRAFRDGDANGNGDPNDEIPFTISDHDINGLINVFRGAWGLGNRGVRVVFTDMQPGTDTLRFWPADEGYRDLLAYLNMLYAEKLLDNECFTITYENFVAHGTSGKVGAFNFVNVTLMGERGDEYAGLPAALTGPKGDQLFTASSSVIMTEGAFVMCAPNPEPLLTMKWLDYFYGEAGAELLFMTEKGLLYDTDENGRNYYVDYVANNPDGLTMSQVVGKYTNWSGGGSPALLMDNYFLGGETLPIPLAAAQALEPYLPEVIWENFSYTAEENEDLSALLNDLTSYIEEMRAQFITGKASLDTDWEAYVNELRKMGLDDFLAIQQAAYDRYNAK